MRGGDERSGALFSYVDLEARVGKDHPLRTIRGIVNEALAALSGEFSALYARIGRPSIPPEKLLRAMLLQAFYSIRLERLEFDLLFRWFVGIGVDDAVWDHSTFSKNRDRLLEGDLAAKLLGAVLTQPRVKRLLSTDHFSVDGTLVEAWASMKSFRPKSLSSGEDPRNGSGEPPAASDRKQTKKIADTPAVYNVTVIPKGDFLVVPKVSSERREYVPIAYLQPPTIPSDLVFVVLQANPYLFGLMTSRMHMSWLRDIGGRLKSDYRYSIALVYNPFPWPGATEEAQDSVAKLGAKVLAERGKFPKSTLGDLYDATTMPAELRRAHRDLDLAVDRLYRKEPFANDRERLEFLLALYEKQKAPLIAGGAAKTRRKRATQSA